MNTKIFKIDRNNIDQNLIEIAADTIKNGELVAFPTETVYGLGADGLNEKALKKVYEAKGRPSDNPLILHISDESMLYNLVDELSNDAKKLIERCWPGPLTIILKKSKIVPDIVTGGLDTVAVRFPKDNIAQALIAKAQSPIAAPSANISGRPSPTRASDVYYDLKGRIPIILDGGSAYIGIESTVIDFSEEIPTILRPGFYTFEFIKEILANVKLDDVLVSDGKIPKSPGQKYSHYCPEAKMIVYVGDKASSHMLIEAQKLSEDGKKVGILAFDDTLEEFHPYYTISLGNRDDLSYMSHVLFTSLREMDYQNVDYIIAEGVYDNNMGKSIMNRMKKSASNNVIYL